jgi:uncharacterized membrane protein YfcA
MIWVAELSMTISVVNHLKLALFVSLGLCSTAFVFCWIRDSLGQRGRLRVPTALQSAIGAVTNFFDTLGIGSFATTMSAFKLLRVVPDERIPGTMIVGHALPVVAQAFIFISFIKVDPVMLVSLIVSSLIGGWVGASIVSALPKHSIQIGMSIALLLAAVFMIMTQFGLFPHGGTALALSPARLMIALGVNFMLGCLVTLGIGNYGPSLVLFTLLGTDPRAAFPVMMGSGAFVGSVAGMRYIMSRRYDQRAALGLTCGGIPAVLVAYLFVTSLPLAAVRWMVVLVVVYTALAMLKSAAVDRYRDRSHVRCSATSIPAKSCERAEDLDDSSLYGRGDP